MNAAAEAQGGRVPCRTCLAIVPDATHVELNEELIRMLALVAPELGAVASNVPNPICYSCHFLLNAAYKFKTTCLRTVRRLRGLKEQQKRPAPAAAAPREPPAASVRSSLIVFNDASTLAGGESAPAGKDSLLRSLLSDVEAGRAPKRPIAKDSGGPETPPPPPPCENGWDPAEEFIDFEAFGLSRLQGSSAVAAARIECGFRGGGDPESVIVIDD